MMKMMMKTTTVTDHYYLKGASSPPHIPRPLSAATGASVVVKRTPSDKSHGGERRSSRGSSRDRHKKYSMEGCLYAAGGMPEQTMRLDPVGACFVGFVKWRISL